MTPEERANWQAFRRETGRPFRNHNNLRPAKLLRIYANYLKAGSVRMTQKTYGGSLDTIRKAIKYVETRELIEVMAVQDFGYMLEAQGVA